MSVLVTLFTFVDIILLFLGFLIWGQKNYYPVYFTNTIAVLVGPVITGTLYSLSLFFSLDYEWLLCLPLLMIFPVFKNFNGKNIRFTVPDYRFLWIFWVAILVFLLFTEKWGGWDAWAIWNLHAKFLFYPESWTSMFHPNLAWSHPDYPVLLPAMVTSFWKAFGGIHAFVPAMISMIFYLLILYVLYSVCKPYVYFGILLMVALLLDVNFMNLVSSQYADSFLALLLLLIVLLQTEKPANFHFWTGVLVSVALSVKNEGYVFLLAICIYIFIFEKNRISAFLSFFSGLLPLVVPALYFKLVFAPTNDLVAGQSGSVFDKLLSPYRYFHILRFSLETLFTKYYTFVLFVILLRKFTTSIKKEWLIPALIIGFYLCIYLITPRDLLWHMSTSMKRLFHHVYPAVLFLLIKSVDLVAINNLLKIKYLSFFGNKT
jgi:hypothetical protein